MARLVERRTVTQRGACQHTERTREHGGLVGKDVAKGVLGHEDVELGRVYHELHGTVVDEHILALDTLELCVHAMVDLTPETGRLEDVRLVDRGYDSVTATCRLVSPAQNTLYLVLAVLHGVDSDIADRAANARALDTLPALVRAKVEAARELADDEQVYVVETLGAQG